MKKIYLVAILILILYNIFDKAIETTETCEFLEQTKNIQVDSMIKQKYFYIIDSGHGNNSSEQCEYHDSHGGCFTEWEYVLDISDILCDSLDELGIFYYRTDTMTRERDLSVGKRAKFINSITKKLDGHGYTTIVLSLHANKSKHSGASGFEIFIDKNKCFNRKMGKHPNCFHLHEKMANELHEQYQRYFPDIKWRYGKDGKVYKDDSQTKLRYITILSDTKSITLLTESGFYSNKIQRGMMEKMSFKEKIAQIHLNSIKFMENI